MLNDYPVHASLATSDAARAKAWFADKIGWQPKREWPGLLLYEVGPTQFGVYETGAAGTAKNTVAFWLVKDLPAEVARLRDRGVVFEDYDFGEIKTVDGVMTDDDGSLVAWFKDPDGNVLGLIEDEDSRATPA